MLPRQQYLLYSYFSCHWKTLFENIYNGCKLSVHDKYDTDFDQIFGDDLN